MLVENIAKPAHELLVAEKYDEVFEARGVAVCTYTDTPETKINATQQDNNGINLTSRTLFVVLYPAIHVGLQSQPFAPLS